MSVGLLGGAFDPPHVGHVALVDEAIRHFSLERLIVVVTGLPPHKSVATDRWDRFRLAEAAFADRPDVVVSSYEVKREAPSYTVETVRWAAQLLSDVIFLVGADEFADFLAWKDPIGVLEHARLGVATRPGYPRIRLEEVRAALARPDRVEFFEIPALPVSSRQIRTRIARGEAVDGLVPERVREEIERMRLYRDPS